MSGIQLKWGMAVAVVLSLLLTLAVGFSMVFAKGNPMRVSGHGEGGTPFTFEREVRTPSSEAYTISEEGRPVGRVDIHFADDVVHVAIAVDESLTQEAIQEIIDTIDEDMVDAVGIGREGFVVHVFQGRETGVFSDNEFGENGSDH